jgi:hypothetical protein
MSALVVEVVVVEEEDYLLNVEFFNKSLVQSDIMEFTSFNLYSR